MSCVSPPPACGVPCPSLCVCARVRAVLSEVVAGMIIRRVLRQAVARRRLFAKVKASYEKVYDEATCRYFYYNVRTGVSTWAKPRLMGPYDIPVTTTPRTPTTPVPAARKKSGAWCVCVCGGGVC
jgi:hypothetical protein